MCSPKFIIEPLTPNVMIFGGETFGKLLGLDEIVRVGPQDDIRDLIGTEKETRALFLPCEDMTGSKLGRGTSLGTESASTLTLDFLVSRIVTNACCLSNSVFGIGSSKGLRAYTFNRGRIRFLERWWGLAVCSGLMCSR